MWNSTVRYLVKFVCRHSSQSLWPHLFSQTDQIGQFYKQAKHAVFADSRKRSAVRTLTLTVRRQAVQLGWEVPGPGRKCSVVRGRGFRCSSFCILSRCEMENTVLNPRTCECTILDCWAGHSWSPARLAEHLFLWPTHQLWSKLDWKHKSNNLPKQTTAVTEEWKGGHYIADDIRYRQSERFPRSDERLSSQLILPVVSRDFACLFFFFFRLSRSFPLATKQFCSARNHSNAQPVNWTASICFKAFFNYLAPDLNSFMMASLSFWGMSPCMDDTVKLASLIFSVNQSTCWASHKSCGNHTTRLTDFVYNIWSPWSSTPVPRKNKYA